MSGAKKYVAMGSNPRPIFSVCQKHGLIACVIAKGLCVFVETAV